MSRNQFSPTSPISHFQSWVKIISEESNNRSIQYFDNRDNPDHLIWGLVIEKHQSGWMNLQILVRSEDDVSAFLNELRINHMGNFIDLVDKTDNAYALIFQYTLNCLVNAKLFKMIVAIDPSCVDFEDDFYQEIGFNNSSLREIILPRYVAVKLGNNLYNPTDEDRLFPSTFIVCTDDNCSLLACKFSMGSFVTAVFYVEFKFKNEEVFQTFQADEKVAADLCAIFVIEDFSEEALLSTKKTICEAISSIDHNPFLEIEINHYFDRIQQFLIDNPDFFTEQSYFTRIANYVPRDVVSTCLSENAPKTADLLQKNLNQRINAEKLRKINFPLDAIPEHMVCPITMEVIDRPVIDPTMIRSENRNKLPRFEGVAFFKSVLDGNLMCPNTRAFVDFELIQEDFKLKNEIEEFVERQEILAEEEVNRVLLRVCHKIT